MIKLLLTKHGSIHFFNDESMPIIQHLKKEELQTFPLPSKSAIRALSRSYKGKHVHHMREALTKALRLF